MQNSTDDLKLQVGFENGGGVNVSMKICMPRI